MGPEIGVGFCAREPVLVHVGQKVVLAERLEECADVWPLVRPYNTSIWQAIGSVGRRQGVVLPGKVTVLGKRTVAEIRPEAMEGPCRFQEEVRRGICVAELVERRPL